MSTPVDIGTYCNYCALFSRVIVPTCCHELSAYTLNSYGKDRPFK